MATSGSSFTPTPLGHEDTLEVRHHPPWANPLQYYILIMSPIRYTVPLRHGCTLNIRRASDSLVMLVERGSEAPAPRLFSFKTGVETGDKVKRKLSSGVMEIFCKFTRTKLKLLKENRIEAPKK
ncbi:hypothetical protein TNCV_2788181 [Trichonephila clavipes]|uniref:Uncharacterized protein n=1 Tax=Trichonephila clavipes TaxID=2585209 RepID=A0A8X6SR12_TRICX|nr:hypothetical protein TNCV_2788181 [Trichonephila clavipes]